MQQKRVNLYVNWTGMGPVAFYKQFKNMEAATGFTKEFQERENYCPVWHYAETEDE
jgi:hypothetical protein